MKKLNNLINKLGIDKVLHYLVGALAIALAQPYGWIIMGIVFIVFLILSIYKEYKLDNEVDLVDIIFYIGGGITSAVIYLISSNILGIC